MVNTQYLEDVIAESGKTKTFLANKCGITIQSLKNKTENRTQFKSDEVDILCNELGIRKSSDMRKIFFA